MIKTYSEMITQGFDDFKEAFEGWTIAQMGFTENYTAFYKDNAKHEGRVEGGLTFILKKGDLTRKVILGYTELGEWLEHIEDEPKLSETSKV